MNKAMMITATVLTTVAMGSSMMSQPTNATASSKYRRSKITTVKAKPYYSTSVKGKTYKFKGSAKHLVLKHNHKLSNYKTSTWTRLSKTTVTKHGKKYLYYYVQNNKNGAKGWVWHKYLKYGKNYMATSPKSVKKGTYLKAKSGKIYQLKGNNSYVKFTSGKSLKAKTNYTKTKQRTIYKHGNAFVYYYVTSGSTKGWVWHSYLKSGKYTAPKKTVTKKSVSKASSTKTTKSGNKKSVTPVVKDTSSQSSSAVKSSSKSSSVKKSSSSASSSANQGSSSATSGAESNTGATFTTAKTVSQAVTLLNQERAKLGRSALTVDGALTSVANARAVQLKTEYDHYFNGVDAGNVLAKQYGASSYYMTEDLTMVSKDNVNPAADLIMGFKNDAHWYDVVNVSASKIGIGMVEDPANPGNYLVAVEMGF